MIKLINNLLFNKAFNLLRIIKISSFTIIKVNIDINNTNNKDY